MVERAHGATEEQGMNLSHAAAHGLASRYSLGHASFSYFTVTVVWSPPRTL